MSEISALYQSRAAMRPTARTWIKHSLFFFLTVCTCTIAAVLPPFGSLPLFPEAGGDPENWADVYRFVASLPTHYFHQIISTVATLASNAEVLSYGLKFSLSLLFILLCHEFGHYIACRIYGVDATLPYFIPTPPLIGPAGTLGAFIKIVSPIPSRRAIFDIGVAGPIAGFVALIPIAIIGFLTIRQTAPTISDPNDVGIYFADPLFFKLIAPLFSVNLNYPILPNPFYFAAWVGLLVTALNLFPSGQLDGGHALFAIFGVKIHKWAGRIVFVLAAAMSVAGWFLYNSPSGFLFAVLLGVMLRVPHPEPYDLTPLDRKRKIIAAFVVIIFILSFAPFPIRVK